MRYCLPKLQSPLFQSKANRAAPRPHARIGIVQPLASQVRMQGGLTVDLRRLWPYLRQRNWHMAATCSPTALNSTAFANKQPTLHKRVFPPFGALGKPKWNGPHLRASYFEGTEGWLFSIWFSFNTYPKTDSVKQMILVLGFVSSAVFL